MCRIVFPINWCFPRFDPTNNTKKKHFTTVTFDFNYESFLRGSSTNFVRRHRLWPHPKLNFWWHLYDKLHFVRPNRRIFALGIFCVCSPSRLAINPNTNLIIESVVRKRHKKIKSRGIAISVLIIYVPAALIPSTIGEYGKECVCAEV